MDTSSSTTRSDTRARGIASSRRHSAGRAARLRPLAHLLTAVVALLSVTVVSAPTSHAVVLGSAKFDGSTGYLNAGASSDWNIGTNDFTIEWFQYQTGTSTFPRIFSIGTWPAPLAVSIENGTFYVWISGAAIVYSLGGSSNYFHKWVHFAITRSSGSLSLYYNGTRVATGSNNTNIQSGGLPLKLGIEEASNTGFPGYLTNFHFVNGTALYTGATLTVPTSPITAVANSKLLLTFDSNATLLTDSSGTNKTVTATGGVVYDGNNPFVTSAPSSPTLNSATGGVLSWSIPSYNGGSPVTDYEYELNGTGTWVSMSTTGTSYTISGLSNGSYSVKVRAVNAIGNGTASDAQTFNIGAAAPLGPTLTAATATSSGAALQWSAPSSDGGSTITDYAYELDGSGTWTSMGTTGTSYTITGLAAATYSVKVRAVNSVGPGTASNSMSFTVSAGCDRNSLSKVRLGNCLKGMRKP